MHREQELTKAPPTNPLDRQCNRFQGGERCESNRGGGGAGAGTNASRLADETIKPVVQSRPIIVRHLERFPGGPGGPGGPYFFFFFFFFFVAYIERKAKSVLYSTRSMYR